MVRKFVLLVAVAAVVSVICVVPAGAASFAGHVDLSKVDAQKEVKDTILSRPPTTPAARKVARAAFTDGAGSVINIDSTIPGANLAPTANVLNSTYHGVEISQVIVHVVTLAQIPTICGDPQAVACYLPVDPINSPAGQIWFAADDPDWVHSLVHEYGHHTDNQLANFGHLHRWGVGEGCDFSADGSREWFFARDLEDDIFNAGFNCDASSEWDHLLPELYAEDFVALNGINAWQLTSARSPTNYQLDSMKWDIDNGLYVKQSSFSRYIKHRRIYFKKISNPNISFLRVRVTGARGRDFDVYLYKRNGTKIIAKSVKGGRVETLLTFIPAGDWDVGIWAYKKAGSARIQISLL